MIIYLSTITFVSYTSNRKTLFSLEKEKLWRKEQPHSFFQCKSPKINDFLLFFIIIFILLIIFLFQHWWSRWAYRSKQRNWRKRNCERNRRPWTFLWSRHSWRSRNDSKVRWFINIKISFPLYIPMIWTYLQNFWLYSKNLIDRLSIQIIFFIKLMKKFRSENVFPLNAIIWSSIFYLSWRWNFLVQHLIDSFSIIVWIFENQQKNQQNWLEMTPNWFTCRL